MSDSVAGAIEAPNETPPEAEKPSALAGLGVHAKRLASISLKGKRVSMDIDGLRYTSTKLPALAGLDLWARLVAMFGTDMLRAFATGSLDGIDMDAIMRAAILATQLGLSDLVRELLVNVEVNELGGVKSPGSVTDDIDAHFSGEYMHLLKVCQFAVAHNLLGPCRGGR